MGFFLVWLFLKDLSQEQKKEIIDSFSRANYSWIILSFVIALFSHIFRTLRWNQLIETVGYQPKFKNTFLSLMIGYFANLAIPRLGEISRCGFLNRYEKVPFEKSFGTVIAERAFDILTFFVLFFLNLALQYKKISGYVYTKVYEPFAEKFAMTGKNYLFYIVFIFVLLLIFLFILFNKKLQKFSIFVKINKLLKGFVEGLKSLGKVKKPTMFFVYTILIWTMYYLMSYVCFYSLPETSNPSFGSVLSVLVMGTIGIMVVQGGIGIYPVIVAETLVVYGVASIVGFALGWLIWGAQTLIIIIAGIISLIVIPVLNRTNHDASRNPSKENISE